MIKGIDERGIDNNIDSVRFAVNGCIDISVTLVCISV